MSVRRSVGPSVSPSVGRWRFRKKKRKIIIFAQIIVVGGIQDESHAITSSYNHFIIMRTYRWPYGPCFTLLVAPSSSTLFPLGPSFLLVPLSSSSSTNSFIIRKRHFFINFDESVTKQTEQTNEWKDKASYRDARTHLTRPIRPTMRPHDEINVWRRDLLDRLIDGLTNRSKDRPSYKDAHDAHDASCEPTILPPSNVCSKI